MPTFTSGNDTFIVHTAGTFDLDFLEGDDTLTVQGGTSTTAHMGLGNDVVQLKSGLATVFGDAGADRFEIYAANATVDGGDDNDLINIRGGSGISASGGLGDDRFNFYADSSGVTLYGDEGDDDFYGYNHNVAGSLYGGAGNDYFVLFQTGAILLGGPGNDIYRITVGSPASVVESVGEGTDSVQIARGYNYALPDNVENISVRGFTGSGSSSATLVGNTLNNHITAHNNDETIDGLDGNDNISGKGGNDTIDGGNGDDRLDGGSGNDSIQGGDGDDVINGRDGSDLMAGGIGNDSYYVDATADVILEDPNAGIDIVRTSADFVLPSGVENGIVMNGADVARLRGNDLDNILYGSLSGDFLAGEAGNDKISGGGGDDRLYGGSGDDYLQGGEGRDEIVGGVGTDVIYGGAGGDTLSGGEVYLYKSVADSSVQTGRDSVTLAFTAVVDLSRIDANSTIEGNQAFTVVDTPTGHEGELWFVFEPFLDEGSVIDSYYWMNVYGDVDGDGVADLAILMVNPGGFTPDNLPSNFII